MKKIIVALLFVCVAAAPASAQKFGYVNTQEVVFGLPEVKTVEQNLQKLGEEFMLQIEEMQVEGNKKVDEYQKTEATLTESMKRLKQEEIQNIGQRIDELQTSARQELASKEEEFMAPLIEKVRTTIDSVMKAQGLAGVFEQQVLIAIDNAQMVDLTPLVKKELGVE